MPRWGRQHLIYERSVARVEYRLSHGRAALDGYDLFPFACQFPLAVIEKAIRMLRVRFFLIEIALRTDVVRAAPSNMRVAAEHHGRYASVGHPHDIEGAAAQMDFVPARHGVEGDVWIAGDHRRTVFATASRHDPVVAASALRIACRGADGLRSDAAARIRSVRQDALRIGLD